MKIRIEEVGYQNFTGRLGVVDFEDGVSVSDVTPMEVNRMSAIIKVVDNETGVQIGALTDYAANAEKPFDQVEVMTKGSPDAEAPKTDEQSLKEKAAELNKSKYTQAQLEALADKEGINGLRAIADPLNVKDNSIKGLIREIMNKVRG